MPSGISHKDGPGEIQERKHFQQEVRSSSPWSETGDIFFEQSILGGSLTFKAGGMRVNGKSRTSLGSLRHPRACLSSGMEIRLALEVYIESVVPTTFWGWKTVQPANN